MACLSVPSCKTSDDKKQSTKFTESNAWVVGIKAGPTLAVMFDPTTMLEGCCCSEAFAVVGSILDDYEVTAVFFLFALFR